MLVNNNLGSFLFDILNSTEESSELLINIEHLPSLDTSDKVIEIYMSS